MSTLGGYLTYDIRGFNGNLYATYNDTYTGPLKLAVSYDGGSTWADIANIGDVNRVRMFEYNNELVLVSSDRDKIYTVDASHNVEAYSLPNFKIGQYYSDAPSYSDYNLFVEDGSGYLYTVTESGYIVRTNDLLNWERLVETPKNFISIGYWSSENKLILSDRGSTAKIWQIDLDDPPVTEPYLVSSIADDASTYLNSPRSIKVQGDYAYVVSNTDDALTIIDVSDPTNPTIVGDLQDNTTLDGARYVEVVGDYAFISAISASRIVSVDISDKTNPFIVDSIVPSTFSLWDFNIDGNYLYIAPNTGAYCFVTLDISDPTNLNEISVLQDPNGKFCQGTIAIYVEDGSAYTNGTSGVTGEYFTVADVSDPFNPTFVGNMATDPTYSDMNCQDFHKAGDYVFCTSWKRNSVISIDVSNPQSPVVADEFQDGILMDTAVYTEAVGHYTLIGAYGSDYLTILDTSDPNNIQVAKSIQDNLYLNQIYDFEFNDGYVYVPAKDSNLVSIYNLNIRQIYNLDSSLDVVNPSDWDSSTSSDYIYTSAGIGIKKGRYRIAEFGLDATESLDWSAVSSGANDYQSYFHYPGGFEQLPGSSDLTFTLYVPIPSGSQTSSVLICPGAASFDEVNTSCVNGVVKTEASPGVTREKIDGIEYWKVQGVDGTGGMSLLGDFDFSDTLSRLEVSQPSTHQIEFGTITGIANSGETIEIEFDPNTNAWDLTGLTVNDLSMEAGGSARTLCSSAGTTCAAGADTWGVDITIGGPSDIITLTAPTSGTGYVSPGEEIILYAAGSNLITNPANVGEYEIGIQINLNGAIETGEMEIPIVDDDTVNITGYIDTTISFDIDTVAIEAKNLDVNTIAWQSGTTVRYSFNGTPDLSGVSVGQYLQVSLAGYDVNNGLFEIVGVDDGADYIEISNTLRTDASNDEAADSSASAFAYSAHCDAAGGVNPCNSHGGVVDGAGYVVDLGEMSLSAVNRSGLNVLHADGLSGDINYIWFDLETNADGGAVVTVASLNESLYKDVDNSIPSVSGTGEQSIAAASGLYGINHASGFTNYASIGSFLVDGDCDASSGDDYYCDVADGGVPIVIFDSNSLPVDDGRMQFAVGAAPDSEDGTGTYTDQLTFIATSTF